MKELLLITIPGITGLSWGLHYLSVNLQVGEDFNIGIDDITCYKLWPVHLMSYKSDYSKHSDDRKHVES